MIARILRMLSIGSNVFGYFYLGYALGNYFNKVPPQYIVSIGTATVVVCAIAILWAISYTGIWIDLAERKRSLFFKWFLFLCVCPGVLGTTTALVRNKLTLSGNYGQSIQRNGQSFELRMCKRFGLFPEIEA